LSAFGQDEAGELHGVDYGGGVAGQGKVRHLTSMSMRVLRRSSSSEWRAGAPGQCACSCWSACY